MDHGVIFRFSPISIFEPRDDRPAHWTRLDAMMRMLIALIATPALLWRDGFRGGRAALWFLAQIRELEREARICLRIDALALLATIAARPRRRTRRQSREITAQFLTADFRGWRGVSFRCDAKPGKSRVARRRARIGASERRHLEMLAPADVASPDAPEPLVPPHLSLRACAFRYEALRRLLENPASFARRLALRLRARETCPPTPAPPITLDEPRGHEASCAPSAPRRGSG